MAVNPNTPAGARVDAAGCPIEISVMEQELLDKGMITARNIYFDTAKSTLVSRQEAKDGTLTRAYAGTSLGGVPYNYYLMDAQSREPNEPGAREIRIDSQTTGDEIDGMISSLNRVMEARLRRAARSAGPWGKRRSASAELRPNLAAAAKTKPCVQPRPEAKTKASSKRPCSVVSSHRAGGDVDREGCDGLDMGLYIVRLSPPVIGGDWSLCRRSQGPLAFYANQF